MADSSNQQPPQYGFTNNYQPSPQAQAFGRVLEALQDPRNSWMGMGMGGSLGKAGKFFGALSPGEMMSARIGKQAGNDSHFFNGPMTKYLDAGGSQPNFGPPSLSSAGQKTDPNDWASTLAQSWQRYNQANEMVSPAINPALREQMMKSMNLRPLGFQQTEEMKKYRSSNN